MPLSAEQTGLYEALLRDAQHQLRACPDSPRRGQLVLRVIDSHRKIANSPAHYLDEDPRMLAADPDEAARRAPKLAALFERLADIRQRGESALVFTAYAVVGDLLIACLTGRGFRPLLHHGSLTTRQRTSVLDTFGAGEGDVLVLTLHSGSVGLNITRANPIIHYDQPWNPAVSAQANDRVHRIGQQRDVRVHHLVSAGSIEERMAALLARKRRLAQAVLPSGELDYSTLENSEIIDLCTVTPRP